MSVEKNLPLDKKYNSNFDRLMIITCNRRPTILGKRLNSMQKPAYRHVLCLPLAKRSMKLSQSVFRALYFDNSRIAGVLA